MFCMILLSGILISSKSFAQPEPCGWTLISQVSGANCYGDCNGSIIVTPSVNWPNFVYSWSHGSNSSQIYDLCADDYTVTVTDDKNCSQQYTFTVENPAQLVANCVVLTNESAPGAADGSIEASVSGGYGPYYYQWQTNPVQSTPVISGLTAGVYTVWIFDEKNCMASTSCEIITEKKEECEGFRSQTQGGWGQCHQTGNNPGTYLFANFSGAFPQGLTIGCTRTLKLTSAQAVCDFLPSGTSPKVLPVGNLVNPGQSYRNVFAGQLVAATLNAQFDIYDPNFASNSEYTLGDLEIASGLFQGWTVSELLAEANSKIGGCGSSFSNSQLSDALSMINENYVDGNVDNGYLVCPEKKPGRLAQNENLRSVIYPNPASDITNIVITTEVNSNLTVEMIGVTGQKVQQLYKGNTLNEKYINIEVNADAMTPGMYFIKVISNDEMNVQKLIIK